VHLVTSNSEYIFSALRLNLTLPVKTRVVSSVSLVDSLCLCPPSYNKPAEHAGLKMFARVQTSDKR
jgi:hypothetical protein